MEKYHRLFLLASRPVTWGIGPPQVWIADAPHAVLPYRQPLAVEPLSGDDLPSADRNPNMAIAARASVENDCTRWRVGIGADPALAQLPLVMGCCARELPTHTKGDLHEALAVPTPVATKLIAPGWIR